MNVNWYIGLGNSNYKNNSYHVGQDYAKKNVMDHSCYITSFHQKGCVKPPFVIKENRIKHDNEKSSKQVYL